MIRVILYKKNSMLPKLFFKKSVSFSEHAFFPFTILSILPLHQTKVYILA